MINHTHDRHDATDRETVAALAASLDLPRGQIEPAAVEDWSARITTQGWVVNEQTATRYLLQHPASGVCADLHLLRYAPDDPAHPVWTPDDAGAVRYAFGSVRLSDPGGTGLLADANLTQTAPDGTVTWLIAYGGTAPDRASSDMSEHETTANPFHRTLRGQLSAAVRRPPWPLRLVLLTGATVLVVIACLRLRLRHRDLVTEVSMSAWRAA